MEKGSFRAEDMEWNGTMEEKQQVVKCEGNSKDMPLKEHGTNLTTRFDSFMVLQLKLRSCKNQQFNISLAHSIVLFALYHKSIERKCCMYYMIQETYARYRSCIHSLYRFYALKNLPASRIIHNNITAVAFCKPFVLRNKSIASKKASDRREKCIKFAAERKQPLQTGSLCTFYINQWLKARERRKQLQRGIIMAGLYWLIERIL